MEILQLTGHQRKWKALKGLGSYRLTVGKILLSVLQVYYARFWTLGGSRINHGGKVGGTRFFFFTGGGFGRKLYFPGGGVQGKFELMSLSNPE